MHVVPFQLTNIVCHSYVTEHTHHQNPNYDMMHGKKSLNTIPKNVFNPKSGIFVYKMIY